MDFKIYSLYSTLIDIKIKFCCLCFKIVKPDAACVRDSLILGLDEVDAEFFSSEEVDIQYILQEILNNEIARLLSENDAICDKCTGLAISSYKFIKMCKKNIESMVTAVKLLTTAVGDPTEDFFGDQNTLFLLMNFHQSTYNEYFDSIKLKDKKSALTRFQYLLRPHKLLSDKDGNTNCIYSKCPTTNVCGHLTSKHSEDQDMDIENELQNMNTVSVVDSATEVGSSCTIPDDEVCHTVTNESDDNKKKYKCKNKPAVCTTASKRRYYQSTHARIQKSIAKRLISREMSKDYIRYLNEISYVKITESDGTTKFQCTECVKVSSIPANARRHFEKIHMKDNDIFESVEKEVKQKNISRKPSICIFCNENFENEYLLTKHILSEHSIETDEDISNIEADKKVFHYVHNVVKYGYDCEKFQCKVCGKLFKTYWNVISHFKKQHLKLYETDQHFICSYCGKECKHQTALRRHEQCHKLKMTCPTCKKAYKNELNFKQHVCVKEPAVVICHHCGKNYISKNSLRSHIKYSHDLQSQRYKCQDCSKTFSISTQWKAHRLTHTKERNFTCDICWNVFATHASLVYHKRIHTGERPYECEYCDLRFLSSSRRSTHIVRHHKAAMAICDLCGDMVRADGMYRHKRLHKNENSNLYISNEASRGLGSKTCIFCNEKFENKYVLTIHILKEHSIETVKDFTGIEADKKVFNHVYTVVKDKNCEKCQCKVCGKLFKNHWNVTTHFKKLHLKVCSTEFICSHCGKVCNDQSSLNRHEMHHTLKITCPTCKKVYKSRSGFKHHVCFKKTARGYLQRDVMCQHCGKNFVSKDSLRIHIRYHHDPHSKRYQCQHCPKTFGALSLLKAHQVRHTRERKFACAVCGNIFNTRNALVQHRRIHAGERSFDCKYCDMSFPSSSRRADHVRRHHVAAMATCDICGVTVKAYGMYKHKKKHNNAISYIGNDSGSDRVAKNHQRPKTFVETINEPLDYDSYSE